jgi:hypothetical protein
MPRSVSCSCDISADYASAQESGVLGYFWSKDEAPADSFGGGYMPGSSGTYSNGAELFYIDAYFADKYPNEIKSTLIHEFQHMINHNQKYVMRGISSDTWFDEMLSLLSRKCSGRRRP